MKNGSDQKSKDAVYFLLIGIAALIICVPIAAKALVKYENTDFFYARIVEIYYTDDDDSVWDEYRYGYTQHTIVRYFDGERNFKKEVSALNLEWEIGQQLKLFEDGNRIRPALSIWANTIACGGFGLCCIIVSLSYFKDILQFQLKSHKNGYESTQNP